MERIRVSRGSRLGYVEKMEGTLGRVSSLDVRYGYCDDNSMIYIEALNTNDSHKNLYRRAMYLGLVKDEDYAAAYTIEMVNVDSEYQGFNLAPRVYSKMLKKLPELILRAGTVQSPGGRYIWYKLAQDPDLVVYAQTSSGRKYVIDDICDISKEIGLSHTELYDNPLYEYDVFACSAR